MKKTFLLLTCFSTSLLFSSGKKNLEARKAALLKLVEARLKSQLNKDNKVNTIKNKFNITAPGK